MFGLQFMLGIACFKSIKTSVLVATIAAATIVFVWILSGSKADGEKYGIFTMLAFGVASLFYRQVMTWRG